MKRSKRARGISRNRREILEFVVNPDDAASSIDLGFMPPRQVQEQTWRAFRQRVRQEYQRAVREDRSLQELAQVEARVRAALEEELLHLLDQSDEQIPV